MDKKKTPSMQSQAYDFIKRKITTCEYAPNQLLSESILQAELGFSRTPVREAIGRLAQEGLLHVFPKRGIIVCGISVSDIQMIYEVRMLIEPYALRTNGGKLDLAEIVRFSDAFQQSFEYVDNGITKKFLEESYELDDRFHLFLISGLHNDYLLDLYSRICTQNIRLRIMSGEFHESRISDTIKEHLQIANACLAQDWDAAARAMEKHLECAKRAALGAILKMSSSSIEAVPPIVQAGP